MGDWYESLPNEVLHPEVGDERRGARLAGAAKRQGAASVRRSSSIPSARRSTLSGAR